VAYAAKKQANIYANQLKQCRRRGRGISNETHKNKMRCGLRGLQYNTLTHHNQTKILPPQHNTHVPANDVARSAMPLLHHYALVAVREGNEGGGGGGGS
jgi:hypothetical protein